MLINTRGIVLKTKKYSETSVIADIFTEAKGLRTYIVSGVRTQRSKISAGLLQIMSPVELVAYHRDDQDMTRLKEIKAHYVLRSIPFDVRKSAVGMFMIEVARKTIREHEENPDLFDFLLENFLYLDETAHFANLHLQFMASLTTYLGFMPGEEYSPDTPCFDLREGVFVEDKPAHPHWIMPELASMFYQLLTMPRERSHEIALNRQQRKQLLQHLLDYYRLHIENFPIIHAHSVLEEVLST
jgi:DNA repair protein RecO (recombination protein O)